MAKVNSNGGSGNVGRCFLKNAKDGECVFCQYIGKHVKTSLVCGVCNISVCGSCFGLHKVKQTFAFTELIIPSDGKVFKSYNKDIMTNESCMENKCHLSNSNSSQEVAVVPLVVKVLKEKHVSPVFEIDENGSLSFLFWQDDYMKKFYHHFPHRVCISLLGNIDNGAIYIFIAEDSDARHEIISVAIDFTHTEGLFFILQAFKTRNPQWKHMKLLVVDTQILDHEKVQLVFPDAMVVSCFYHVWKTFSYCFFDETINTKALRIKYIDEMLSCSNLACTDEEFQHLYSIMSNSNNSMVLGFNLKNIHKVSFDENENFLAALNAFLCSVETKIKSLVLPETNIVSFIQKITCLLQNLRRDNKIKREIVAFKIQHNDHSSVEFSIESFLTPSASKFIQIQMKKSLILTQSCKLSEGYYKFEHLGEIAYTGLTNCTCVFFSLTSLVCCHIFALRNIYQLPFFEEIMFNQHLTKQYFYDSYSMIGKDLIDIFIEPSCIDKLLPIILKESYRDVLDKCLLLDKVTEAYKKSYTVIPLCNGISKKTDFVLSSTNDLTFNCDSIDLPLQSFDPSSIMEEVHEKSVFDVDNCSWTYGKHLLNGSKINLLYLKIVICKQKKTIVEWLQNQGFLPSIMICPLCNANMVKSEVSRLTDGAIWMCNNEKKPKKLCARRCSVRKSTWFDDTSMSLEKILIFCYMWIHCYSQQQILLELGISAATYMAWDKTFLNVITNSVGDYINNNSHKTPMEDSGDMKELWKKIKKAEDIFVLFLKDAEHQYQKTVK